MFAFPTREERADGAILLVRWLPPLVQAFERGVVSLGLQVTRRSASTDPEGRVCPVIAARKGHHSVELHLRNSLEDFLLLDREADPPRLDADLQDDAYAERKLAEIVVGRLELLREVVDTEQVAELPDRLAELGAGFEWIRVVVAEEPGGQRR